MSPDSLAGFSKSPDPVPTPSQLQLLFLPCSGIRNKCSAALIASCLLGFEQTMIQRGVPSPPRPPQQIPRHPCKYSLITTSSGKPIKNAKVLSLPCFQGEKEAPLSYTRLGWEALTAAAQKKCERCICLPTLHAHTGETLPVTPNI